MSKFWKIFRHEYRRHVLRKRFIVALLSLPLSTLVMIVVTGLTFTFTINRDPVGYIDQAGLLKISSVPEEYSGLISVDFIAFPEEAAARAALDAEEIQAFFVLPAGYPQDNQVHLYYLEEPDGMVESQFRTLLRLNLLAGQPEEVTRIAMTSPRLVTHLTQEEEEAGASTNVLFRMILPWSVSAILLLSIITTTGYLMQAVVDEKENRMMEILATSVRPEWIMHAKVLALILVGLTQIAVWTFLPSLGLVLVSRIPELAKYLSMDWKTLAFILVTTLPTFLIYAGLIAALGAVISEAREGQAISGLITLLLMAPFGATPFIMSQPNGVLPLILSFFPMTSTLTLLIRMGITAVPDWQIILSAVIVIASAAASVWFSGFVFRWGMLRYGKDLDPDHLLYQKLPVSVQRFLARMRPVKHA